MIYLTEEFGGKTNLYPEDKMSRIKVLDLLFFNGTNLFRKDSDVMTEIIVKSVNDVNDIKGHLIRILECYESLETFLTNSSFLAGNTVSCFVIRYQCLSKLYSYR